MLEKLGIFFGGFISPVPLVLLALAAGVAYLALGTANGRFSIGMSKPVARREWDAARARRDSIAAKALQQQERTESFLIDGES